MAPRRNLVVDADVLRAAGKTGKHGSRPVICSHFLTAILEAGHGIAVTDQVLDEWKRHRSPFSSRWLRAMFARRRVVFVESKASDLSARTHEFTKSKREEEALLKDVHLVEAALAADKTVASLDELTRGILRRAARSGRCNEIAEVMWVNPERETERIILWLRNGAPDDHKLRLSSPL